MRWNGQTRQTVRIDNRQLRAQILASDVAAAGTAQVTVHVPGGQGATSPAATFTVVAPPVIASVAPGRIAAGGDAVTLVVEGSGFAPDARIHWAGRARTTSGTGTRLTTTIPAADLARPATIPVTVVNPGPPSATSAARNVPVVHATPVVSALSPASGTQGGSGFELLVRGRDFVRGATVVLWNGAERPTRYLSPTEVRAAIPASDLARAGTARVEVRTQVGGSTRTSRAAEFTVAATRIVVVEARTVLAISSFRLRGGVPYATPGAPVSLDAATLGSPSLYRAALRRRGCEADLASTGWQSYSSAVPPTMTFSGVGAQRVCFQVARGDAASPTVSAPAEAGIQIVPWRITSPQMGSGRFFVGLVPDAPNELVQPWALGIGLDVRAGTLIDHIALRRARLGPAGERSGVTTLNGFGGTGGRAQTLICPNGQAMVGVRGRRGLVLDRIEVACRPFRQDRGTHGTTTWIGPVGGSGGDQSYSFVCPPPHAVFLVSGAVTGAYASGIQLDCLPPTGL